MPIAGVLQHSYAKGFVLFQQNSVPVDLAWMYIPLFPGFPCTSVSLVMERMRADVVLTSSAFSSSV